MACMAVKGVKHTCAYSSLSYLGLQMHTLNLKFDFVFLIRTHHVASSSRLITNVKAQERDGNFKGWGINF